MKAISASKKGQVQSIAPAIIALMIAGIFLILGIVILQEIRDTDIIAEANTGSVVNESLTTVNQVGDTLSGKTNPGSRNFAVVVAINASNGYIIPATNYTLNRDTAVLTANPGYVNNTNWNVTYSFTFGDQAYIGANGTLTGIANFSDFWEIIVLALVISIVIGLLLLVFGGGRRAR